MLRRIAALIGVVGIAVALTAGCGSDEPVDAVALIAHGDAGDWAGLSAEEKTEVATEWVSVAIKPDKRAPEAVVALADASDAEEGETLREFFQRVVRNPPEVETDNPRVVLAQPPSAWDGLTGPLKREVAQLHIAGRKAAGKTPDGVVEAADATAVGSLNDTPLTIDLYLHEAYVAHRRAECDAAIGPLVTALEGLGSRTAVGINFISYTDKVGGVRVEYDRINAGALAPKCLRAARAAESALNAYVRANDTWSDCIGDFSCTQDSIVPKLHGEWARASKLTTRARNTIG